MRSLTILSGAAFTIVAVTACQPTEQVQHIQVEPLQVSVQSSSSSTAITQIAYSSASSAPILMSRRACTNEDFYNIEAKWQRGEPTTTVAFEHPELSFSVPYNPAWGSTACQLEPYSSSQRGIEFGPADIFEGGGAARFGFVEIRDARTKQQVVDTVRRNREEEKREFGTTLGTGPEVRTINGNTVVEYGEGGFCEATFFEVIGTKHNYVFQSACDVELPLVRQALSSLVIH
ncbi:MAG: hypothetical protein Greene041619_474 [Candidatus Peregrinibacteria bacterium Greene0416_19]|nr:MAG: hypothetical protein Greene041619_474 [Candidatus Peregrinibacteria bacterium Greene0416_19]